MTVILDDNCTGTGSLWLWALGRLKTLSGFMGSKRKDAPLLCQHLGIEERPPDEVRAIDAGPWGDVWTTLQTAAGRRDTCRVLLELDERGDLPTVWPTLLYEPPEDPAKRAAQYLCLQARSAGCIPIWWNAGTSRWESPSGSRTETAHQRGGIDARRRMRPAGRGKRFAGKPYPQGRKIGKLYRSHPARGLVRIFTLADRVAALDRIDWGRVTIHHGDVFDAAPIPGSRAYFDPPYSGAPRYAALLPRHQVLQRAQDLAAVCDLVIVSESEPLPLEGWHAQRLRLQGKPEWITCSRRPATEQLGLWAGISIPAAPTTPSR